MYVDRSYLRLFFLVSAIFASEALAQNSQQDGRAIGLTPTPARRFGPVTGSASAHHAGLFVGVNEFVDDEGLNPLSFAVNDAIAQAHLFVIELKLIPPANCFLALAGEPTTDQAKKYLAALEQARVHRVRSKKSRILKTLGRVRGIPQAQTDMLVVSISSHGFEDGGTPFAMPTDGLQGYLRDTALNLTTIERDLARSKAGKRILLIDACRERPIRDGKGGNMPMTTAFRDALANATGQAVLASCDAGQISYENLELGHGVFTYYLLQALRGHAPANEQGHITLGSISDYVARSVRQWAVQNKSGVQHQAQRPWFKGPTDARDIPLAEDPGIREQQAQFKAEIFELIRGLRLKFNDDRKFNYQWYRKVEKELNVLTLQEAANSDLFNSAKLFVSGKLSEWMFVTVLEKMFPQPKPKPAPVVTPPVKRPEIRNPPRVDTGIHPPPVKIVEDSVQAQRHFVEGQRIESMGPPHQAFEYFQKAANLGHVEAMVKVAQAYVQGNFLARQPKKAFDWYLLAAQKGHVEAMYYTGYYFSIGQGVGQDLHQSVVWYTRAADNGNPAAMYCVGYAYEHGFGVEKSIKKAIKWYDMAAKKNHDAAIDKVAKLRRLAPR